MRHILSAVLTLALCLTCLAQDAVTLKVKGDTVLVVKSVPFEVEAPEGATLYTWSLPPGVEGQDSDNVMKITKAPQGEFVVRVTMLIIDFEKKKVIKQPGQVTVNYGGVKPPDPKPKPDGKLGLEKASRDAMGLVTSLDRDGQARKLAQAHRTHASKVGAGVYPDAAKILDGWRAANRAVLSESEQKVWSPWAGIVKLKVEELHKGGSLPTDKEWADAFNEIAAGLASSSKSKGR